MKSVARQAQSGKLCFFSPWEKAEVISSRYVKPRGPLQWYVREEGCNSGSFQSNCALDGDRKASVDGKSEGRKERE